MFSYIKYSLFHLLGLFAAIMIFLGGGYITFGLAFTMLFVVFGDLLFGDDKSIPEYKHERILIWQLWVALPLLCLIVFAALWQFAETDLLQFGEFVQSIAGIDILSARGHASFSQLVSCIFLTGFNIGVIGTVTAHELTHRTNDKISLLIGRWLLAFSFDVSFSVEHVYGHHRYVSTAEDPATAPRGRNVYTHILISTYRGNLSAWNIEKGRLAKNSRPILSVYNSVIRGYLMSVTLLFLAYYAAGFIGLALFIFSGLWGKSLLEIVNYMEHYGLIRVPKTKVQPRHSWNTNKLVSSWVLFNLTRHSHHHAKASVPFYKLEPMENSPTMISGYLGTIMVALIPPLWHKLMTPKILDWDKNFSVPEEQYLINNANQQSGISELVKTSKHK